MFQLCPPLVIWFCNFSDPFAGRRSRHISLLLFIAFIRCNGWSSPIAGPPPTHPPLDFNLYVALDTSRTTATTRPRLFNRETRTMQELRGRRPSRLLMPLAYPPWPKTSLRPPGRCRNQAASQQPVMLAAFALVCVSCCAFRAPCRFHDKGFVTNVARCDALA